MSNDTLSGWDVPAPTRRNPLAVLAESGRAFRRLTTSVQITILGVVAVVGIAIGIAAIPHHDATPTHRCYDPTGGVYGSDGSKAYTVCVSQGDGFGSPKTGQ
jgi:hypothetical protein